MKINPAWFSKRKIFILGLILIGAGLLLNEWALTALFSSDGELAPRSVVVIWLFDVTLIVVGLVLTIGRSFSTLINFLVGIAFAALLLYGVEKFFYRLNHTPPPPVDAAAPSAAPPPTRHEGTYTDNFFYPDELLGYKPRPDSQVNSLKKQGDDVVYDVIYSIDRYSRRMTPTAANSEPRDKFLLFFGDSFTFGEGVNDNETLPYYVSEMAPQYHTYNYGFSGYGPQQMLAKLQSDDLAAEVPETDGIAIYVFIDAHVERAIGSMFVYNNWGEQMPYYTTDWSGNLVRKGNFKTGRPLLSSLYSALGDTEFAKYYNLNIPGNLTGSHYGKAARIIAGARDAFREKYDSDEFYVVIYPDEGDYFEDMQPHFEAAGLKILNYDERMKLDPAAGLSIKGDGHPTGKAHKIVAEWIAEDLMMKDER